MRAKEFIIESKSILLEKLMGGSDWSGPRSAKYVLPFLDNIGGGNDPGQVYAFNVGFRSANKTKGIPGSAGKNFLGTIADPVTLKRDIKRSIKTGDWANILFSVNVVNNETNKPTGETIDNVRLTNIYKDEKIKGELVPNMGNVSEALLGCAVAAKFVKNGEVVTEKDLVDMGRQLAQNGGVIRAKAGKDTLEFKVTIPYMDTKAFYAWLGEDSRGKTLQDYNVPDKSVSLIERRAKAAVEYANTSKRVAGAVQAAQNDPGNNKVDVISDGGEKDKQSTTKVDLKILIDGQPTAKRLLSVKAGNVAQFGQVTGVNFEHAQEFFSGVGVTLPENLRKYFYEIAPNSRNVEDQKQHNFDNGFSLVFQNGFKQLKARAASDQAGLVEDVYQGLLHHLTRKEEGVEMVILDPDDKKAFRELSFGPEFEQALRQLQLVVTESSRDKGYNISIYGFPIGSIAKKYIPSRKDADSKLVDLTSQFKDGSIRNMLGMGSLLKNIADIENYIDNLVINNMMYHFEDDAKDILSNTSGFTKQAFNLEQCKLLNCRTKEMLELDYDYAFEYALLVLEN
jgi:hypothetical protein